MKDIETPNRRHVARKDQYIVMHICVSLTGLLISCSGLTLLNL